MKIVKYLEHNNVQFFVNDHVVLNAYNKPEISGVIETINENYRPGIMIVNEEGTTILKLDEIENIRKIQTSAPNIR